MPAKQSQEVRNAMQLVDTGVSIYDAAHQCDVWPSTLYRALNARDGKRKRALTNKPKKGGKK